jgi:hypothetical protein
MHCNTVPIYTGLELSEKPLDRVVLDIHQLELMTFYMPDLGPVTFVLHFAPWLGGT